jgi:Tfp pilus assembly protein PilF
VVESTRNAPAKRDKVRWAAWSGTAAVGAALLFAGFVYEPPPSVDTLVSSAQFMLRLGLVDEAQQDLASALERDPEHAFANLLMAGVHERHGDWDEALRCYEAGQPFVDASADEALATEYLVSTGLLRLATGDLAGAAADAERALARNPDRAGAILIRAFSRLGGGDDTGFRQDLRRAYSVDPHDPFFRLRGDLLARAIPWASAVTIAVPGSLPGT